MFASTNPHLPNEEGTFAQSPIGVDTELEGVSDSTRYFVLKVIGGGGRKAYIGIGFGDRNDAFDLKSGIQRFQSIVKVSCRCESYKQKTELKQYLAWL
jgi:adaptin ear-binding coat-associated protein 1/2